MHSLAIAVGVLGLWTCQQTHAKDLGNPPIEQRYPLDPAGLAELLPKGFQFGASTAAYQIEGAWNEDGRGPSIWDTFSKTPGNVHKGDTGDVSVDHYHKWQDDIQLLRNLGVNSYRFSISWSRVIPTGFVSDGVNEAGIAFYDKIIDALLEAGITPYVCLYHWDLPQGVQDRINGWLGPKSVDAFADYADLMFQRFGDRVKHWASFNEPLTFCNLGYGVGVHAPGTCTRKGTGDSYKDPYTASRHVLLAHATASQRYQQRYAHLLQDRSFSIVLNSDWFFPLTNSSEDLAAVNRAAVFWFGWFADPVFFGQFPQEMLDALGENITAFNEAESELLKKSMYGSNGPVIGVNHYTSHFVKAAPRSPDNPHAIDYSYHKDGKVIGKPADSFWLFVVPGGIRGILNWIHQRYKALNPSLIVMENGVDCPDEDNLYYEEDWVADSCRVDFLSRYIENAALAIQDGVPLKGYFVWSLLDNFEWADGFSKRFGIVRVQYNEDGSRPRIPKNSYWFYRDLIHEHQRQFQLPAFRQK